MAGGQYLILQPQQEQGKSAVHLVQVDQVIFAGKDGMESGGDIIIKNIQAFDGETGKDDLAGSFIVAEMRCMGCRGIDSKVIFPRQLFDDIVAYVGGPAEGGEAFEPDDGDLFFDHEVID